MPKAHEVASELRKLADSLDREPEAEITEPTIVASHYGAKEKTPFMNLARLLPRPYEKKWKETEVELRYDSKTLTFIACIQRSIVCELIEPAKPAVYRCDPLLSVAEEAALETAVAE